VLIGQEVVRTFDQDVFVNVPVTGSFTFDSDEWSLTSPHTLLPFLSPRH
jgi:hypothetical protein